MGTTCRYCGDTVEARPYCGSCQRPMDAAPSSLVSATRGNCRLDRLLGEGPIGMVYDATHVPSGRRVRLKLIDGEGASDAATMAAASQLAVGAAGLHESLPELVEVGLEDAAARALAVAWRDGETLRDRLGRGVLAETEACIVVGGVLRALDALHEAGLSHRDVKPENVLLAPPGQKPTVHLLDVGPSLVAAKARTGAHYRSPEQAKGAERVGPATDIYACGALLYEALTGRRPYDAGDYDVLMSQIALRRPPAVTDHQPGLDPDLVGIVTKAMEPSPGDRFRSAADMLRALRTFVAAQQRPSTPEQHLAAAPVSAPQHLVVPEGAGHGVPQAPPPREALTATPELPASPPAEAAPAFHFERHDNVPTFGAASPTEPAARAREGGAGARVAAVVFLLLALAGGGALLYYTMWARGERDSLAARFEQDASATAPRPAEAGRAASRGSVRINLTGLPQGAVWTVDGRPLTANPFRAPRSDTVRVVRVEAPGFQPFQTEVSFANDLDIGVEMTPLETDAAPPPAGFKAFTHGRGANQRPGKRLLGGAKQPESRFGADRAPDQLRERR